MSRSTQFIGLNNQARLFAENLTSIPSDNKTEGMFNEEIPLRKWRDKDGNIYNEIEQVAPWSSGPMIFTCLEITKPVLGKEIFIKRLFEWREDHNLKDKSMEYDSEEGTYYV